MRTLDIRNLGPIKSALFDLSGDLVVITGPHGAGKSTVANALYLAKFGETLRLPTRGSLYELIYAGAENAEIVLTEDGTPVSRRISCRGPAWRGSSATAINQIQMDAPWLALTQKPAIWQKMLGSVGISTKQLAAALGDTPIINEILARAAGTLKETIANLEAWRLELHRQLREQKPPEDIVDSEQGPVSLRTYVPHRGTYQERLKDMRAEYENLNNEYQRAIGGAMAAQRAEKRWEQLLKKYPEARDEAFVSLVRMGLEKQAEVITKLRRQVEALSTAKCPTCLRQWSPEAQVMQAEIEGLEDLQRKDQALLNEVESLAKASVGLVPPVRPTRLDDLDKFIPAYAALLQTIDEYVRNNAEFERSQRRNEEIRTQRTLVQAAIEYLRSPAASAALDPRDSLQAVRSRLATNCKILGFEIEISNDLQPLFKLPDGTLRNIALLSDTERALAGLAVIDAFARVSGVRMMVVDQMDMVRSRKYTCGLANLIQDFRGYYDLTLVLSSDENWSFEPPYTRYTLCSGEITHRENMS